MISVKISQASLCHEKLSEWKVLPYFITWGTIWQFWMLCQGHEFTSMAWSKTSEFLGLPDLAGFFRFLHPERNFLNYLVTVPWSTMSSPLTQQCCYGPIQICKAFTIKTTAIFKWHGKYLTVIDTKQSWNNRKKLSMTLYVEFLLVLVWPILWSSSGLICTSIRKEILVLVPFFVTFSFNL